MAESVIERGRRLLAEEQAQALAASAAADQAAAEAREQELLQVGVENVATLLSTVLTRLEGVEQELAGLRRQVMASRVRRPVRGEDGTILYVVDELQAPELGPNEDGD